MAGGLRSDLLEHPAALVRGGAAGPDRGTRCETNDEALRRHAALWLPWCVDRGRHNAIIKIDQRSDLRERALQLRVGDLADALVRQALGSQRREGARPSLEAIKSLADQARSHVADGTVVLDAAGRSQHDGPGGVGGRRARRGGASKQRRADLRYTSGTQSDFRRVSDWWSPSPGNRVLQVIHSKLGGRDSNPDSRLQRPESCH